VTEVLLTGHIAEWCVQIRHFSRGNQQRTGQMLMNLLPVNVYAAISGTPFDPFHKDFSFEELYEWIDSHLIFGEIPAHGPAEIIAVFNGDQILWSSQ
jgi:hypothetical protein